MTTLRIVHRDARANALDHPARFFAGCSLVVLGAGVWCAQVVSHLF